MVYVCLSFNYQVSTTAVSCVCDGWIVHARMYALRILRREGIL